MVDIEYYGGNTLKINSKEASLVINPKRSIFGKKDLNVLDCIEISTESDLALNSEDAKLIINSPGEYEVADCSIKGFAVNRHTDFNDEKSVTNYVITIDDVNIVIIGNSTDKISESHLEKLGLADVLIIPVGGGGYTLDGKMAAKLAGSIEPKIVIPVHYKDGSKYEVPQDSLEEFVSAMGLQPFQEDKLKIKKISDYSEQNIQIIELKPRA